MLLTLIFAAVLAVAFGSALLFTQPGRDADILSERLEELYSARPHPAESPGVASLTEDAAQAATAFERALRHNAFNGLRSRLRQSQSTLAPARFLLLSFFTGSVLCGVGFFLSPFFVVRLVAFAAGAIAPWLWIGRRRSRRMRTFEEALPDAADLISRSLRAGHSVQQSIEIVAQETTGPVAEEFRQLHQEQKFGVPLREALRALAARVPSPDLQFLVTAIVVQKETGGNLVEVLDRTSSVIRDRFRVEREVKTHTAQGRLTGWILSALPVVLLVLTTVFTPDYSSVMFHDHTGQMLLLISAALIVIGSCIIRRVVRVEV